MKDIKKLFFKAFFVIIPAIILYSSTCFANIDNQTSLTILHGNVNEDPNNKDRALQPLENYKPPVMHISTTSNSPNKQLLQLDKFIVQITKCCTNNYLIAHAIGGVILFEYLKSITKAA